MKPTISPAVILRGSGTLTYTFSQRGDKFVVMASNNEIEEEVELDAYEAVDLVYKLNELTLVCKALADNKL